MTQSPESSSTSIPTPNQRQYWPRTPDEWISFGRLLLAGLLWIPAVCRKPRVVAVGIAISAASDIADGLISRLLGRRSQYARQLDTIADSAIMLSSLGWLALSRPGSLTPIRRTLVAILGIGTLLLAVEWFRFRLFGALHIDSARAAAVVGHLYILNILWRNRPSRLLLRFFQFLVGGAVIESAWVILGSRQAPDGSSRPIVDLFKRTVRH